MITSHYNTLLSRAKRLQPSALDSRLGHELGLLALSQDKTLGSFLTRKLDHIEASLLQNPFAEINSLTGLGDGQIHILNTSSGRPVRISFHPELPNHCCHICIPGRVNSGKSCLQAVIASRSAPYINSVIIDTNRFFRKVADVQRTHTFVRWEDLRINIFDVPSGFDASHVYQVVVHEICSNYGLQFAAYEMLIAVKRLREKGCVTLPFLIEELRNTKVQGFSKRGQYRDSALLILTSLIDSTRELFLCSKGMDLQELFSHNIVLEVDGLLCPEQAFIIRYFFEYLCLSSLKEA